MTKPKVLISDALSPAAVQIFKDRGIEVDFQPALGKYKEKLADGGRASGRFVPPTVPANEVEHIAVSLRSTVDDLSRRVNTWTEKDLDTVLMPHPLLGKLTAREMLFFTIYHVQHHHALVERDTA